MPTLGALFLLAIGIAITYVYAFVIVPAIIVICLIAMFLGAL